MRPFRLANALGSLAITAAVLCNAGCDKDDTIRVYNAPKEAVPPAPVTPVAAKPIEFSVPQGWVEGNPTSLEYARFSISPDDPKAVVTVSTLATQAGLLLPNVNRWQRQLKLPETGESELGSIVRDLDLPAGKAQLVDLTGPEPAAGAQRQRIVAVILPHGPRTWYLKLAGPVPLVEAQRSNFDTFLNSVKFPTQADSDAGGSASTGAGETGVPTPPLDATTQPQPPQTLSKWTAPPNWKQDAIGSDSPRLLSFKVAADDNPNEKADISVSRMSIDNLVDLLQDINMWRSQVGLPPQTKLNDDYPHKVTVGGTEGALFDFAGPQADKPEKRVMVAMVPLGADLWFFKITGPAGLVSAQKPGFLSFVESAEFAPQ